MAVSFQATRGSLVQTAKALSSVFWKGAEGGISREIYPCWPEDEPKYWLNLYPLKEDTAGERYLNQKRSFVDFIETKTVSFEVLCIKENRKKAQMQRSLLDP